MNLQIRITQDQSAALLRMGAMAGRALPALGRAFGSAAQEVLGRAIKNRFTGSGPFPVSQNRLGVKSHRLRKSLRATRPQVNTAAGTVSVSLGSNVSYYAGHEFGFRGRVQVKGHVRKALAGTTRTFRGKLTKAASAGSKARLQSGRGNYSYVRPHSRRLNIPARAPLGTELAGLQTRLTFFKKFTEVIRLLTAAK